MQTFRTTFLLLPLVLVIFMAGAGYSQNAKTQDVPKVEVYYFHPSERCPVDQSIEENTVRLMRSSFAQEIKSGIVRFAVIDTDDKSKTNIVSRFDINAQALFIVYKKNGKENKNDLTDFAFSTSQASPERFRSGLKSEIQKALKAE